MTAAFGATPALPCAGGNFRLGASVDEENWDVLLEGYGPWAGREVDLTPYTGRVVFVRFDNPKDKGKARIRAMRLMTTPRL